jgi:hypothetical protein
MNEKSSPIERYTTFFLRIVTIALIFFRGQRLPSVIGPAGYVTVMPKQLLECPSPAR